MMEATILLIDYPPYLEADRVAKGDRVGGGICNIIIGKGGNTIRRMTEYSGASIISWIPCERDQLHEGFRVFGTAENVGVLLGQLAIVINDVIDKKITILPVYDWENILKVKNILPIYNPLSDKSPPRKRCVADTDQSDIQNEHILSNKRSAPGTDNLINFWSKTYLIARRGKLEDNIAYHTAEIDKHNIQIREQTRGLQQIRRLLAQDNPKVANAKKPPPPITNGCAGENETEEGEIAT